MTTLKRRLTRKMTRQHLRVFLESHATDACILDVGAKNRGYQDLFPNAVAGDIAFYPSLDVQLDAHRLPFACQSFGTVLCTEVLEHCLEPQRVIDEFYRVLKPGGKLILTTRFIFPIHDAPHDYYRFTRYGLMHLCRQFETITVVPEVETVATLAVILQRMAAQIDWKVPGMKLALQVSARLVAHAQSLLQAEYGDISRRTPESVIMASGYYLVAVKDEAG